MVDALSRFSYCLILFCFVITIFSCETQNKKQVTISGQGLKSINCIKCSPKGIKVDTILFADGYEHIVLSGVISSGKTSNTYALYFDQAPWKEGARLLFHKSSIEELANAVIDYKIKDRTIEIIWNVNEKRMFLRDVLTKNINVSSN